MNFSDFSIQCIEEFLRCIDSSEECVGCRDSGLVIFFLAQLDVVADNEKEAYEKSNCYSAEYTEYKLTGKASRLYFAAAVRYDNQRKKSVIHIVLVLSQIRAGQPLRVCQLSQ